jgi:preprotein translocase subunit SecY
MFPMLISSFWPDGGFHQWWIRFMAPNTWAYMAIMFVLIIFFAFFYSQIQFNPIDVAKNIQQHGGFIPGIRPGKPTSEYLGRINNRITLFGALFLAFVASIPAIVFMQFPEQLGLTNAFSATGLLIVVSVAMELNKQLEGQLAMKNYKGFLK